MMAAIGGSAQVQQQIGSVDRKEEEHRAAIEVADINIRVDEAARGARAAAAAERAPINPRPEITVHNRDAIVKCRDLIDGHVEGYGVATFYAYSNSHLKSYEGQFHLGKVHGHGKLTFTDGSIEEGEFENGNQKKTIFRTLTGIKIDFERINDTLCMQKTTYKNGDVHESMFEKGQPIGVSFFKYEKTEYKGGMRVEKEQLQKHGLGTLTHTDTNCSYEGTFINDMKHGNFVVTNAQGNKRHVYYFNDKEHPLPYKNGQKHGYFTEIEDGVARDVLYTNGVADSGCCVVM